MISGLRHPDANGDIALVLSGGGARAAYQVGVLSALAERFPDLQIRILTGVSAGAINMAHLAAHRGNFKASVGDLRAEWSRLTPERVYSVRPLSLGRAVWRWLLSWVTRRRTAPGVVRGLMDMTPLRQFLSNCIDFTGIDENLRAGKLRAAALTTTSYTSGHTITFVHGAPEIPVWERSQRIGIRGSITLDLVMASSAIPIIFPAVKLPDGFYGDGSVRQIAPLAPAIHLGAQRIIAISMRASRHASVPAERVGEYPAMAEVMGLLFNSVFLDSLDADAERLERINQLMDELRSRPPKSGDGLRRVNLLLVRPSEDLGALSRGYTDRLPDAVRWAVSSIGGRREGGQDFVSYLLFDPVYTDQMVELGYRDVCAQWDRVERFIDGP